MHRRVRRIDRAGGDLAAILCAEAMSDSARQESGAEEDHSDRADAPITANGKSAPSGCLPVSGDSRPLAG